MLTKPKAPVRQSLFRSVESSFQRFAQSEAGSLTIFTLFIFIVMLMITGMAVDMMRFEARRVALQNTLDRAVLAAADMDQSLTPEDVVQDYFDKAGLGHATVLTHVDGDSTFRTVEAFGSMAMDTHFMHLMGIDTLAAPAIGGATEGMTEVEISLVLDVSGSMGWNNKLPNLKVAAKDFVDTVIDSSSSAEQTHISIIPFSTQVNAGSDLGSYLNFSNEHSVSHCADWDSADFQTSTVSAATPIQRTSHFNARNTALGTSSSYVPVCRTEAHRQILAYENDNTTLKNFIDSLSADGWTSIEIGTKWGTTLLDPGMQGVVSDMITDGKVDNAFEGRPMAYGSQNLIKVLIVMSDGANTKHWEVNDGFRDGLSPFWYDANSGVWSYDDTAEAYGGTAAKPFFYDDPSSGDTWDTAAYGTNATQMTWPQVWAYAGVEWFGDNIIADMANSNSTGNQWIDTVMTEYGSGGKNTNTSNICSTVRNRGVVVYAIGFETDAAGDAALKDCASSASHFFNASGTQISDVFASIAADITQLRLTY